MGFVRRHWLLSGAIALVVVVLAGVVVAVLSVDGPGPASVDDALGRFRENGVDDGPAPARGRPPEGVYLYSGEGVARLSFPPLTQRDGDEMPATVSHRPRGCWVFRVDFNANHWQEWTLCRVGDGVVETGGRNGQEWDLGVSSVGNVSRFRCRPPNPVLVPEAEPGAVVEQTCAGTNSAVSGQTTSAGPSVFVGVETLTIGDAQVETLHVRGERTLTGGQEGDGRTDAWFRPDGLLVRYERDIEVRSDSPIGVITYTEAGDLQLTDLRPRT
jgi:hypothetical protein